MTRILVIASLVTLVLLPEQDEKRGKRIYEREKCASCHGPGKKAEDLLKAGPLWSPGWYAAYLTNPPLIRPGSKKKSLRNLSREDLLSIGIYLSSLQKSRMRERSANLTIDFAPPKIVLANSEARKLYVLHCAPCHGTSGEGDGVLADQFSGESRPRSFIKGRFRRRDPTVRDIFLTVSLGMPGSGMGSFEHLSRDERWAIAKYVLTFSPFDPPTEEAQVPEPLPPTRERILKGAEHWMALGCRTCHGGDFKGRSIKDTVFDWKDEAGRPLPNSRDLTSGILTTGSDPKSIYRTVFMGRDGTPMPSQSENLKDEEDRWALVAFVRSLFDPKLKALREKGK